jgi:transposase
MSKFRQAVYDRLDFSRVKSEQFQSFELKERAKQCAFYDAYLVMREWIKRVENLKIIIGELMDAFKQDEALALSFLRGKRFSSKELNVIRQALSRDCFGNKQSLSVFFLNNFILQLRNLFLARNDLESKVLFSDISLSNPLQALVRETFNSLRLDDPLLERAASSFTRTRKKKEVAIPAPNLPEYFINGYFRKIQWLSTQKARQLRSLRKKLKKEEAKRRNNANKLVRLSKSIENLEDFISLFLGKIEFTSEKEFKKKRKSFLDGIKKAFLEKLTHLDLEELISKAYQKELLEFQQNPNQHVLKRLFKPSFERIHVSINYDSFVRYFELKLQYKMRELLKERFISEQFVSLMIQQFKAIKSDIYDLIKVPRHKTLSISIMNRDVYKEDFTHLYSENGRDFYKIKLGLISHQFKSFKVRDDKERVKKLKERDFKPALPSITLKNRKLLLNLPFTKTRKESSKPSQVYGNQVVEMGIDLGLKHFAVISIFDKEQQLELARYFLGPRQVLDMSFNLEDGKLHYQKGVRNHERAKQLSNIKLKLIRLREQIVLLQRKKNDYEQRSLLREGSNYRVKLKWNKTRRSLSLCWDRVNRINIQLVNHLTNNIVKIANFWNVSVIKVEDLRWATHSKKRDAGKFMTFWQTHWFYSQVQNAVKLQCDLNSLRFQKVPARYTSQSCSSCGKLGSRASKQFSCPHCGFKLDSDLNAARNIVKYYKNNI